MTDDERLYQQASGRRRIEEAAAAAAVHSGPGRPPTACLSEVVLESARFQPRFNRWQLHLSFSTAGCYVTAKGERELNHLLRSIHNAARIILLCKAAHTRSSLCTLRDRLSRQQEQRRSEEEGSLDDDPPVAPPGVL